MPYCLKNHGKCIGSMILYEFSTLVDIMHHTFPCIWSRRSEIHENLKCSRCNKNGHVLLDGNGLDSAATEHNTVSTSREKLYDDIGGFGEISGCMQKMNSSNQQVVYATPFSFGLYLCSCFRS